MAGHLIIQTVSKLKLLNDQEIDFYYRDSQTIDDVLYEDQTIYNVHRAANLFNSMDVIFIDGEPNLLPWSPKAIKVQFLRQTVLLFFSPHPANSSKLPESGRDRAKSVSGKRNLKGPGRLRYRRFSS